MGFVTVFEFELFDPVRRAWNRADFMATAQAVERMGGVVIHRTARTVEAAAVGPDGRLKAPRPA